MLKLIDSLRGDKEAYLALERAGEHHVDLLPGMVFQRAPAEVERSAARRLRDSIAWGKLIGLNIPIFEHRAVGDIHF
jgi:hypothetical protein